jgi:DNA-binding MarR family transcriptional regulator
MDTLPGKPVFVSVENDARFETLGERPGDEDRPIADDDYRALANFRYLIRGFLATSETLARHQDLNPQQHQCLLAIAGRPPGVAPTIGYIAERLLIEHNSAVGLVDRLVSQGLVERRPSQEDRRQVHVHLTPHSTAVLEALSHGHREELRVLAPQLVKALRQIVGER